MWERVFDVDEVDVLIPRLELLVERLQSRARQLREAVDSVATEQGRRPADLSMPQILQLRPDLHGVVEDIGQSITEIEDLGCVFKDLELGLVDFPAEINGEPAYLCWQYGEKAIEYWHCVTDGFNGRRPLSWRAGAARPYLQ